MGVYENYDTLVICPSLPLMLILKLFLLDYSLPLD